jgi:hypothetical protein
MVDVGHLWRSTFDIGPCFSGCQDMSDDTRDILTNTEVIAVNQDPAGYQGTRVVDNNELEVWMKALCRREGPAKAIALLNRGGGTASMSVSFDDIGISGAATVRDLWAHEDRGEYAVDVASHGVVMRKIVRMDGKKNSQRPIGPHWTTGRRLQRSDKGSS